MFLIKLSVIFLLFINLGCNPFQSVLPIDTEPEPKPEPERLEIVNIAAKQAYDKEVLGSSIPVFLYFYTDWCSYCTKFAPVVDEIFQNYKGRLKICKVNVNNNEMRILFSSYNLPGYPSTILLKKDADQQMSEAGKIIGYRDYPIAKEYIDSVFGFEIAQVKAVMSAKILQPFDVNRVLRKEDSAEIITGNIKQAAEKIEKKIIQKDSDTSWR